MATKIKKLAAGLFLLAMMAVAVPAQLLVAFAASGKITFSDPSVTVGNQVSVTMKITTDGAEGLGASDVMLEYDSSALEFVSGTSANGGAGSIRILGTMESVGQQTFTFTLKFNALKAGTTTISVKSQEVYDSNSQAVSISHVGSSAVKVNAPVTYSKEASLSSLEISPGELSPAFSPDVTEYTATVSGSVDKVTVSAPAKDSKATVSVSGNEGLQTGENEIVCKVTAEDGETVKTYTIKVTKTEETGSSEGSGTETADANAQGSGMNVTIGEENWQVAASFDAAALPEGFAATEYVYNGTAVQAGYNEAEDLTLLYLTNEAGEGDFFLFMEAGQTFAPYVTVKMAEKTIIVLPKSELPEDLVIPDGFADCSIDIGEYTVEGWIWETNDGSTPEYCVVYGMNSSGEKNLYRYDQKEMTLQRYFQDPAAESTKESLTALAEEYNSLLKDYSVRGWMIGGLFAVCIVLVIVLIVLLMKKPGGPKKSDRYYEERLDGDRENLRRPAGRRQTGRTYEEDEFYEEEPETGRMLETRGRRQERLEDEADDFGYRDEEIEDLDGEFGELEEEDPELLPDQEGEADESDGKETDPSDRKKKKDADEDDDFEFIDLDL